MVAVPSIGRAGQPSPQHAAPEADATRRLYEQYARQIYAYCLHQLRNKEEAEDATRERLVGAERAAETVREAWRALEEFNLAPQLALEALFVQVAGELS